MYTSKPWQLEEKSPGQLLVGYTVHERTIIYAFRLKESHSYIFNSDENESRGERVPEVRMMDLTPWASRSLIT